MRVMMMQSKHYHNLAQATSRAMSCRKACLSGLSLQERYLLTEGIEMVVVYQETRQITTTPAHTGCVTSSGSPCPLSATSMEQRHNSQSAMAAVSKAHVM